MSWRYAAGAISGLRALAPVHEHNVSWKGQAVQGVVVGSRLNLKCISTVKVASWNVKEVELTPIYSICNYTTYCNEQSDHLATVPKCPLDVDSQCQYIP